VLKRYKCAYPRFKITNRCGNIFKPFSMGFRIRSTKALIAEFSGEGGGLSSTVQQQFLANQCCPKCINRLVLSDQKKIFLA
jgi:hypothetical protein